MSTVKDFFLTELPAIIAEMKATLGDRLPKVSYDVEFEIEGEGMYSVAVKAGEATVRRGGAASPTVSLAFAKATWDEALANIIRPRLKTIAAAEADIAKQLQGRKPVAPEAAIKAIQSLPLRVLLELEPKGAHRFELKLAAAEDDDPTVTVSLKQEDMDALLSGKLTVQDAFKTGRLRMKGAVSTVMALLSRLFV